MGYQKLTHNQLIRLLAQEPAKEQAWKEFVDRFHEYICAIIHRECKRRDYSDSVMQVEDLAQEVYMILVNNDCSPLKKFKGRWENSIYKYLGTTAVRVVLNRIEKAHAQKRPPNKKKYSINNPVPGDKSDRNVILEEILCTLEADAQMREKEFREEIEDCLDKMVARRRNGAVYREIYKYSLYEGLSPKLIQAHLAQQLSLSRINNIITEVKTDMQKCIQQKRRKNQ